MYVKASFSKSRLQTKCCLKLAFQKLTQHTWGNWLITAPPNTTRTVYCKALNFPVKYCDWEYRFDIKKSDGNVFNPMFINSVQLYKHLEGGQLKNKKMPSFTRPKFVIQRFKRNGHGHKYPRNDSNHLDKWYIMLILVNTRSSYQSTTPEQRIHINQFYRLWWVTALAMPNITYYDYSVKQV